MRMAGFALSALALGYVLLPDPVRNDPGLLRLAGHAARERAPDEWEPVRMHALANRAAWPVAPETDAPALVSDLPTRGSRAVSRAFAKETADVPAGAAPSARRYPSTDAAELPGLFSFETDDDIPRPDIGRRGWLGEAIRAADRAAETMESTVAPDVSGVLGNSVFGKSAAPSGGRTWSDAPWTSPFDEDDALFRRRATREEDVPARTDGFVPDPSEDILSW